MSISPVYGIVGGGRMAKHFHYYLKTLQQTTLSWTRQNSRPPQDILQNADIIIILIKDMCIESFIRNYPILQKKTLIHFSGALSTELAFGFHPLMSFTENLYTKNLYRQFPFILNENSPVFHDIFPNLPNPHYRINRDMKPLYHAMCVLAGNGMAILWQKLFSIFESELSLPKEISFPYLQQVTKNLMAQPQNALTGPIVRQDHLTIQKNLDSLAQDSFLNVYKALYESIHKEVLS